MGDFNGESYMEFLRLPRCILQRSWMPSSQLLQRLMSCTPPQRHSPGTVFARHGNLGTVGVLLGKTFHIAVRT